MPPKTPNQSPELTAGRWYRRLQFHKRSQLFIRSHNETHAHDAVIRVYDAAGNVIETQEHTKKFKEP